MVKVPHGSSGRSAECTRTWILSPVADICKSPRAGIGGQASGGRRARARCSIPARRVLRASSSCCLSVSWLSGASSRDGRSTA